MRSDKINKMVPTKEYLILDVNSLWANRISLKTIDQLQIYTIIYNIKTSK